MTQVCFTSAKSVGCTFLDWSVHFLSGQTNFYALEKQTTIPLCESPLTSINAHKHQKNCSAGYSEFVQCVSNFDRLPKDQLYSIYAFPMHLDIAASDLAIDSTEVNSNYDLICKYINNDYNKIPKACDKKNIKLVVVADDTQVPLYFLTRRSLDRWICKTGSPNNFDEAESEFHTLFFNQSKETWPDLHLSNIWDRRERRALDFRLQTNNSITMSDLQHPHLWLSCYDLWTRGEEVIKKIMDYLELAIATDRKNTWQQIYKQWQTIQLNQLEFSYNYRHIIAAIINNWYYEINLTFDQEVVIQHVLMYEHNLNLKTWGLEKFPTNTQELHKLLEPNLHTLTPY